MSAPVVRVDKVVVGNLAGPEPHWLVGLFDPASNKVVITCSLLCDLDFTTKYERHQHIYFFALPLPASSTVACATPSCHPRATFVPPSCQPLAVLAYVTTNPPGLSLGLSLWGSRVDITEWTLDREAVADMVPAGLSLLGISFASEAAAEAVLLLAPQLPGTTSYCSNLAEDFRPAHSLSQTN